MKHAKSVIIVAVLLIIAGIGILTSSKSKRDSKEPTLILGAILPLSGTMSKAGNDVRAALEIARNDFASRFGDSTLLFEDDEFKPDKSVSAFKKLSEIDSIAAVIGPLNGSSIEAVRSLSEQSKTVAFTPWGAGNTIGGYVFKNSVEADEEASKLAEVAVQKLGLKRLGIVYLQNDFGIKHLNAYRSRVDELGGKVVVAEAIPVGITDFHDQLLKVKSANVEGLYIVHNGANVGKITKQAKELGIETQLFGQYATESSDLVAVGGDSLEGLIYTFPIDESKLSREQQSFIEKFGQKTGGKPQVAAYNAYDIYFLLADATKQCKNEKKCAQEKLSSITEYSEVSGTFSFEHNKLVRQFFLKTIQGGKLVRYDE